MKRDDERVDVGDHVSALCAAFALDKSNVSRIVIEPATITFGVYKVDASGAKYVETDGEIAHEELTFKVST